MPTILRSGPYRVFFYSGEAAEPPHVHVERDGRVAKIWLKPVRLQRGGAFTMAELRIIEALVRDHRDLLWEEWHAFFGKNR